MHEEPDRRHDVIEAPLEIAQHIPDPVLLVDEGSRPKRSPKPKMYELFPCWEEEEVQEVHQESWDLMKTLNKFTLGALLKTTLQVRFCLGG